MRFGRCPYHASGATGIHFAEQCPVASRSGLGHRRTSRSYCVPLKVVKVVDEKESCVEAVKERKRTVVVAVMVVIVELI